MLKIDIKMRKIIYYTLKFLCLIPFIWLLIFFSYVIRVTNSIGRIPVYNNPQSGQFSSHFKFLNLFFEIVGLSFLAFLILYTIYCLYYKHNFDKKYIYLWWIGNGFILLLFIFDPYGLIKWWID